MSPMSCVRWPTPALRMALAALPPSRHLHRPCPAAERVLAAIRAGDPPLELLDRPPADVEAGVRHLLGHMPRLPGRAAGAAKVRSQRLLHRLGPVLSAFHAEGIPALLLKGAALALFWYRDPGRRPMVDADVLTLPADLPRTRALLHGMGWSESELPLPGRARHPDHVGHDMDFVDAGGCHLDLHYYALNECRWPGADAGFWERSRVVEVSGAPCRILSDADMLVHLVAHGYRRGGSPPRWASDAALALLGPDAAIDWDGVVREARARHLVLPVLAGLTYLRDAFGCAVPAAALAALEEAPVAWWEPVDLWARAATRPGGRRRRLLVAPFDYLRRSQGQGVAASPAGLARYLRERWGLADGGLLRESGRRLRAVLGGLRT